MATAPIGTYLKDGNYIYEIVLGENKKKQLKERLLFSQISNKWIKGSDKGIDISPFLKAISKVPKITEEEFKKHQSNE